MSDRAEIEKILREAGLQENATQECLTIFEKERITSNVLPRLSVGDLRDMGIVTGDRRLLFNHLNSTSRFGEGASAPPPPEAVPICDEHNQPISGLCTQPGCEYSLVCNDCVGVGDHRSHTAVDGLKGIGLLRSRLEQWKPSTNLETLIEQQQKKVSSLHNELVKEQQELKKLQDQQQVQTNARARIAQSLSCTENMSPGPDALHALKELRQLVSSLEHVSPPGVQFAQIVGTNHEHLMVTANGKKIQCVGANHQQSGAIDPRPINYGDDTVEWTLHPHTGADSGRWIGFGVIPVTNVPTGQTGSIYSLFYGWSVNGFKWNGSDVGTCNQQAAVAGTRMRLSLDCERCTLTLTNLDNNETNLIEGIPFPVYPFVTLFASGDQLSVV
eukprot:TRINITY_DN67737_c11_g1_i2.p1 TRINITY_DN67737_c11_g1~~TRINITY_DN67737_c11_g1_i2.p1  ORF type:complete len:386 (-),score=27.46 TRINITY_DN67737_c11_g1_i2:179-1336(-)